MELRHLQYFVRVVEVGSVSRAASSLHIGQPTMSRQLAALSRELKVKLLERTATGVTPTLAGRELYLRADAILRLADALPDHVRGAGRATVEVRVGIPSGLPRGWFGRVIKHLAVTHPQVSLELLQASTDEQRMLLQQGRLDIALLHVPPPEAPHRHLLTQPYGVAGPPNTTLARRRSVQLEDLAGRRWLTHSATGHADDTHLRETAAHRGVDVDWVLRPFSESLSLVAHATGVSGVVLTRESCRRRMPDWSWIPLDDVNVDGEPLAVRTWAAWREPVPTAVREVVDTLFAVPTEKPAKPPRAS